jgi:uroporphyrinogen decarboxylase
MSSRERVIATIKHQPTDHLPLSFEGLGHGWVEFVSRRYADPFKRAEFYLDQGLDMALTLRSPTSSSWYAGTTCTTKQWEERVEGETHPLLVKEYVTPKGNLRQVARKTEDFPGDNVHLFSDHNVPPARTVKYAVEGEEDLDKLEHVLQLPPANELAAFRTWASDARRFCDSHEILLSCYVLGVGDPMLWMSGVEPLLMMAMERPDMLQRYADTVSQANRKVLEVYIDAGVDLVVRRGWYESTDFWSPPLFREIFFPRLEQEIDMAHQAGVYYTYVQNSGSAPLLDYFLELGFDISSNVDPLGAGTDLRTVKEKIGERIALYGGVNNNFVIERGTVEELELGMREAVELLGPGGGYVMGPADALLSTSETTERNFFEMVRLWKTLCEEAQYRHAAA